MYQLIYFRYYFIKKSIATIQHFNSNSIQDVKIIKNSIMFKIKINVHNIKWIIIQQNLLKFSNVSGSEWKAK